jgi:RimJ/RimL family protein N-acetyltransferase
MPWHQTDQSAAPQVARDSPEPSERDQPVPALKTAGETFQPETAQPWTRHCTNRTPSSNTLHCIRPILDRPATHVFSHRANDELAEAIGSCGREIGIMARMLLRPDYPVCAARLMLRPLVAADTEDLVAYRSLDEVCRFVPFAPMDHQTVTERLEGGWARKEITDEDQALTLGVELAEASHVVGDVVLFFRSAEHRSGEIGWVLHPGYSGQGYATEASHILLHLAFDQLGLHRVVARVDARNEASLRLANRLGMRREAHLVSNEWFKGDWSDEIDFAILEDEWAAQHTNGPRSCPWPLGEKPRRAR